jgi:acetolactate synthase regulatory subunit
MVQHKLRVKKKENKKTANRCLYVEEERFFEFLPLAVMFNKIVIG